MGVYLGACACVCVCLCVELDLTCEMCNGGCACARPPLDALPGVGCSLCVCACVRVCVYICDQTTYCLSLCDSGPSTSPQALRGGLPPRRLRQENLPCQRDDHAGSFCILPQPYSQPVYRDTKSVRACLDQVRRGIRLGGGRRRPTPIPKHYRRWRRYCFTYTQTHAQAHTTTYTEKPAAGQWTRNSVTLTHARAHVRTPAGGGSGSRRQPPKPWPRLCIPPTQGSEVGGKTKQKFKLLSNGFGPKKSDQPLNSPLTLHEHEHEHEHVVLACSEL